LVVKLPNYWVVRVVKDVLLEEICEVDVASCLWLSHQKLADSQNASDEIKGPFCLTILLLFQICMVGLVDCLHFLNELL